MLSYEDAATWIWMGLIFVKEYAYFIHISQ